MSDKCRINVGYVGYHEIFNVSKATATRDLTELVEKWKLFDKVGQTGAGTVYTLKK